MAHSGKMLLLVVFVQLIGSLAAFSPSWSSMPKNGLGHLQRQSQKSPRPNMHLLHMSSNSDPGTDVEIEQLEQRIRKLKEERAAAAESKEREEAIAAAKKMQSLMEDTKKKNMLLTEGDLIKGGILTNEGRGVSGRGGSVSDEEGVSGVVPAVLGAVVAVVFLILFSQIPVGQDNLSKYSAPTGPTTSTRIDLGDLNPDRN